MSRPYLEVKVIKIRKKERIVKKVIDFQGKKYMIVGIKPKPVIKEYKPKGNWVNGEHLDKIKFPCFCSYSDGEGSERKKGFLSMNNGYYYIANINTQKKMQNDVTDPCLGLNKFITKYNIHILKGKIILFDDTEDTDEKYDIDIEEEK